MLAAACLLLVVAPVIQRHLEADRLTGVAELNDVVLPDGSMVNLDAASAIAVDFSGSERRVVLLAGQAFFQVSPDPDRFFRVTAADVSVRVTGTAFGVDKLASTVTVSVQSGNVEVSSPGAAEVSRLGARDRLVFDRRTSSVKREQVMPSMIASWRAQRLVVQDAASRRHGGSARPLHSGRDHRARRVVEPAIDIGRNRSRRAARSAQCASPNRSTASSARLRPICR